METEKQTNYYIANQFQTNVPLQHPLKTAETLMFFRYFPGAKKGNIGLKWVDNSGREIISIRNNSTLIYGINGQNTTSTSPRNNVINGVTIFIFEKFKGLCEWYFKLDIAEFEFDYAKKIKLKTFIDKICNVTEFSIFFSSSFFKPLMTWSFGGRTTWRVWLKDLLLTQTHWLVIDH